MKENGNWQYYYTFTDPLGSILYAYNESGTQQTRQSFDAWGRYRSPTNWNTYTTGAYPRPWLYRGYTGHEMLPAFNLINMNGRLYDPLSARMLSADPIINSIYNTQAYNRFSYVWNNPLKFVDPMGYNGVTPPTTYVRDNPGGVSGVTGWRYGKAGETKDKISSRDRAGGGSAFGGWLKGFFASSASMSIHQSNGYQSSRSLALAGFGLNQSHSSFGSMASPREYDPWDYQLTQGPPGEGDGDISYTGRLRLPPMPPIVKKVWPYTLDFLSTMGGATAYHVGLQLEKPLMKYVATALSTPGWGRFGYNTVLTEHSQRFFRLQQLGTGLKYAGFVGAAYSVGNSSIKLVNNYQSGNTTGSVENVLDIFMTGVSFIPKVGWVIGGTYFLIVKPIYHHYYKP